MILNDPYLMHLFIFSLLIILSILIILKYSSQQICVIILTSANLFNVAVFIFNIFLLKRFPGISIGETFYDLSVFFSLGMIFSKLKNKGIKLLYLLTIFSLFNLFISAFYFREQSLFTSPPEVLNNSFWIILHVSLIIIGYGLVMTASAIAHFQILRGLISINKISVSPKTNKSIVKITKYGTLFITVGTILGSFWAKIAWGRFWDWDPKETAVLIVIITLLGGLLGYNIFKKNYLISLYLPIIAFVMIVFTWIGINFLQKGIHSYGVSDKGLFLLLGFTVLEVLFFLFHIILKLFPNYK